MKFKLGIIGGGKIGTGLVKLCLKKKIIPVVLLRDRKKVEQLEREIANYQRRKYPRRPPIVPIITIERRKLYDCNLIIEAINENFTRKVALYQSLRDIIGKNSIIGTTTSSLSINALARKSQLEDQFIGLHFFNPPQVIPFIEIVPAKKFKPVFLKKVIAFIKSINYDFVIVPDVEGFVANRLLFSLLLSAVELAEMGIDKGDIDQIVKKALKHPMGPFELIDLIGIETADKIVRNLYQKDKNKIELWSRYRQ